MSRFELSLDDRRPRRLVGELAVLLSLAGSFLLMEPRSWSAPNADEILKRSDDVMDPGESTIQLKMTIYRKNESDRIYKVQMFADPANERMLAIFEYPARSKGQAYLRLGDVIWLYLPNINKTMRVPKQQAFAGGDFSNNDMLVPRFGREYKATLEGEETVEGHPCYRLFLSARNKQAAYATIRSWIRKDNFWPVKREFNTIGKKAFKSLRYSAKFSKVRPDQFFMSNILERNKVTILTYTSMKAVKHDPMIFSESYLKRRR